MHVEGFEAVSVGCDSSVGIATRYGLDSPGIMLGSAILEITCRSQWPRVCGRSLAGIAGSNPARTIRTKKYR